MKLHMVHRNLSLPITILDAWDFFSNPSNLVLITPPSLGLEIASDVPDKMFPGAIITYRVRPILGIPMTWVTEITHMMKPYLFVDEQRFGPYRFWHHKHLFKEIDGGIEVEDLVHYALPFGPIGDVVNGKIVGKQLDEIFDYRQEYLTKRFGGSRGRTTAKAQL